VDPSIIPLEKCKTNAIGWLHPELHVKPEEPVEEKTE